MQPDELYERGMQFFKSAEFGSALTCFRQADEKSPDGSAKEAIEMVENILNFRNADLMNP